MPVTLLCGFLGSGKTTLLKHVLETKHSEVAVLCIHMLRHLFVSSTWQGTFLLSGGVLCCLLLFIIVHGFLAQEDFKCAVIVNDMAELNIDKSLIDQTSLIQSDEAMVGRYLVDRPIYSNYLHFDFHLLCSMTKLKEHSREIC